MVAEKTNLITEATRKTHENVNQSNVTSNIPPVTKPNGKGKPQPKIPGESKSTIKRQRSGETTPNKIVKRRKTFAEVLSDDLKVLIIDKNSTNGFDEINVGILEISMLEALDLYIETDPTEVPNYHASKYLYNNIKVVCADAFSLQWLKQMISNLPTLWEGIALDVVPLANKNGRPMSLGDPKKKLLRPSIKFFVPDGMKKLDFDGVAKRLAILNRTVSVKNWEMWKKEVVNNGMFYNVSVDESDIEEINRKGGRLHFYYTTIKIITPKRKTQEGVEVNMETEEGKAPETGRVVGDATAAQ